MQVNRVGLVTHTSTHKPVITEGVLPNPFNVNKGSFADRRSDKGVLPENALVTKDDMYSSNYPLWNFLSPGQIQDMTEHLKKYNSTITCDEIVKLNGILNEAFHNSKRFDYSLLSKVFDDMNRERNEQVMIKLYEYEVIQSSQVLIPDFDANKSNSEIYQKLMDLGIINSQGKIQGAKLENPETLRLFNMFINNCDGAEKASFVLDMIYKKYDTYYLNEFNEYHWVRYLNSFEVPKASDQQLVNQTDTLHSNIGQDIFNRLLASTILVRSNTDDKIIINNPKDIKPDVFRVLKDDYGVEFAMAIGMDLDNKLNRLKADTKQNIDPTPATVYPKEGHASGLRMSRKLLIMLAAAALGSAFNSR